MASRIEDYGLIGNCRTAALVSAVGSIDWLCAPTFASDACFSALLGYDEHGRWSLRPAGALRSSRQRYRGDTMILETEMEAEDGVVRIIDFMPVGGDRCDLIRIVEGVEGKVPLEVRLDVAFGYGADRPWVLPAQGGFRFTAGPQSIIFRSKGTPKHIENGVTELVEISRGQRLIFQLSAYASHEDEPEALDADAELERTEAFWSDWAARCTYEGRWKDAVLRSLLVLKALTYEPTGAIVAAPTTSLPEELGGVRNWDYRYCWLRDASLTLEALLLCGYVDEAEAFRDWVLRAAAGAPEGLQIMYDIFGGRRLTEYDVKWLPGYEASRPVRIGNAASEQFQLDVYGEVMSALDLARSAGMRSHPEGWKALTSLVKFIERAWQMPDDGIWEVRGGRQHFTYSKVMAWVAVDRAIRGIEQHGIGEGRGESMLSHLRTLRARIHEEVCQRGFHPGIGAFTQAYGSEVLDASVLLMPHVGFLPGSDPRIAGTIKAVERGLMRDGFVLRYDTRHTKDGLPGTEGAFLACSFWLADNYAYAGRIADAEAMFERLLALRNGLGLLAEEYEPRLQRQIGNFPQAFSHLALIATASIIDSVSRTGEVQRPPAMRTAEPLH